MAANPFNLERFVDAQEDIYATALRRNPRRAPSAAIGCGLFSPSSPLWAKVLRQSASASRPSKKLRAYLQHPVLGGRLRECVAALHALAPARAEQVFGPIDALKLRSSLTLFDAANGGPQFAEALHRWFGGGDSKTVALLQRAGEFAKSPKLPK